MHIVNSGPQSTPGCEYFQAHESHEHYEKVIL